MKRIIRIERKKEYKTEGGKRSKEEAEKKKKKKKKRNQELEQKKEKRSMAKKIHFWQPFPKKPYIGNFFLNNLALSMGIMAIYI